MCGFYNEYLWKKYADSYKGVVIGFNAAFLYEKYFDKLSLYNIDYDAESNFENLVKEEIAKIPPVAYSVINLENLKKKEDLNKIHGYPECRQIVSDLSAKAIMLKRKQDKEHNFFEEKEHRFSHFPLMHKNKFLYRKKKDKDRAILKLDDNIQQAIKEIIITDNCNRLVIKIETMLEKHGFNKRHN